MLGCCFQVFANNASNINLRRCAKAEGGWSLWVMCSGIGAVEVVGPYRSCSPHHVIPFNSINAGLQCGG